MKNKNKLSYSEYCKLDTIKSSIPIAKLLKERRVKEYNKNPKCCLYCNKPISYERKRATFCNSSCAAKYNNHNRVLTNGLKEYKKKHCKWCGAEKGKCKHPEICKLHQCITRSLIPYFGFNQLTIGTEKIYEEFIRVKNMLYDLYWNQHLSLQELKDKFPLCSKGLSGMKILLNAIGIKLRTNKQAVNNFIKQHPDRAINQSGLNINYPFKSGWHTTWDNKKIFYRSNDELEFAKQLDEKKILYEVEKLRIFYYDTQKQCERLAVVDFYLPDTNEIFEIKGYMWYNETTKQNMRDKFVAYKKAGYIPHLIVNNSEIMSF